MEIPRKISSIIIKKNYHKNKPHKIMNDEIKIGIYEFSQQSQTNAESRI